MAESRSSLACWGKTCSPYTLSLTLPPPWPSWAPPSCRGRRSASGDRMVTTRQDDDGEFGPRLSGQRWPGCDYLADPGLGVGLAELGAAGLDIRVAGVAVCDQASEFGFAGCDRHGQVLGRECPSPTWALLTGPARCGLSRTLVVLAYLERQGGDVHFREPGVPDGPPPLVVDRLGQPAHRAAQERGPGPPLEVTAQWPPPGSHVRPIGAGSTTVPAMVPAPPVQ